MKKIVLILLLVSGFALAQDTTFSVLKSKSDTLTATIDSVQINFEDKYDYILVSAQSTANTNTITIQTPNGDGLWWIARSVIDLATKSPSTTMSVGTSAKEFIIYHPEIRQMRLLCDPTDSVLFNVKGIEVLK